MSDPLKARLPCLEHGWYDAHTLGGQEWCPGGREVLLIPTVPDYETAGELLYTITTHQDDDRWTFGPHWHDEAAQAIVAAAVGDTWTIKETE